MKTGFQYEERADTRYLAVNEAAIRSSPGFQEIWQFDYVPDRFKHEKNTRQTAARSDGRTSVDHDSLPSAQNHLFFAIFAEQHKNDIRQWTPSNCNSVSCQELWRPGQRLAVAGDRQN
jgi:hypothetical protein